MNIVKRLTKNQFTLPTLLALIFFSAAFFTLPHYGINWDTINHLPRGQAYLNYFLTGRKDFSNLDSFKLYWQDPQKLLVDYKNIKVYRSLYQSDAAPFNWFLENDGNGHPPLSDILSSVFNLFFFQKLHLINDIDAYRIYSIFLAASLIFLLYFWLASLFGRFTGFISALSLALYPLFWSEAHFNNEKDIPETVYWSFLLFFLWKGVNQRSWKLLLIAGIFFGLCLGTKFNVLFILPLIGLWIIYYYGRSLFKNCSIKILLALLLIPMIGIVIFFTSWPYLWSDPIVHIDSVIKFYKTIGVTTKIDQRFTWLFNINIFPLFWGLTTTPLVILLFSGVGFIKALRSFWQERSGFLFLVLLWLLIPIARVSLPNASIYGGIRQIMEFIPALAILAGFGASSSADFLAKIMPFRRKGLIYLVLVLSFLPILLKLISIHPNENVYFNPLIGGLKGARDYNIPYWGNSFGSTYRQGVVWINDHAKPGSKIVLARELLPNIPTIWLRSDLEMHNSHRSGYLRKGEYVISLTYQGTESTSYFDRYLNGILIPVYEIKVDEVPILKVWQNDIAHTKKEYLSETEYQDFSIEREEQKVTIDLGKNIPLSRLLGSFTEVDCQKLQSATVAISSNKKDWVILPGTMPKEDWSVPKYGDQPSGNQFLIPFAADQARFIRLNFAPKDACFKNITSLSIFWFPDAR